MTKYLSMWGDSLQYGRGCMWLNLCYLEKGHVTRVVISDVRFHIEPRFLSTPRVRFAMLCMHRAISILSQFNFILVGDAESHAKKNAFPLSCKNNCSATMPLQWSHMTSSALALIARASKFHKYWCLQSNVVWWQKQFIEFTSAFWSALWCLSYLHNYLRGKKETRPSCRRQWFLDINTCIPISSLTNRR